MRKKSWKHSQADFIRRRHTQKRVKLLIPLLGVLLLLFLVLHHPESLGSFSPAEPARPENPTLITQSLELDHTETENALEHEEDPVSLILTELSEKRSYQDAPLRIGDKVLTIDVGLQAMLQSIFRNFNPPHAAAVVVDVQDGSIVAMVGYERNRKDHDFLPLRPVFPAASVFKLVTAAAAIEHAGAHPSTPLFSIGNPYRLNPQKFSARSLRQGRHVSLEDAMAKSNNVAFADLTRRFLNHKVLLSTASQFGFDRTLTFDLPVAMSKTVLPEDSYPLAKASTGLGGNTLSPLHAVLIAEAIANEGKAKFPKLFRGEEDAASPYFIQIPPTTARFLGRMMQSTISSGTARKSFRGYKSHPVLKHCELAGKTGSLNSKELKGQCDWFVGYGKRDQQKLAVAIVMVNQPIWHIKPAYVARKIFEEGLREGPILASHP